jgi:hypothetical protein
MSINWAKHAKRLVLMFALAVAFSGPLNPPSLPAPAKPPATAPIPLVNWNS